MIMTIPMTNKISLQDIWVNLKANNSFGFVKRLYNSDFNANVYVTYKSPQNIYGIGVSFNQNINVDISSFDGLKELNVVLIDDTSLLGNKMLCIQLNDKNNLYIFASLCEYLIDSIANISDEKLLVKTILNQLASWRNLFGSHKRKDLSENEQLGLFGELSFLKFMLQSFPTKKKEVLLTWVGAEKSNKDFQGHEWAVEVKSSINKNNKVTIHGETQLDQDEFEYLILCNYVIDRNNIYGTTLPQLIDDIEALLKQDIITMNYFMARMQLVGYYQEDRSKYELRHYNIKKRDLYNVTSGFPRIVQNDLRKGVHDVNYAIMLDVCGSFLISDVKLLKVIEQL